jgi:hypothetical protein
MFRASIEMSHGRLNAQKLPRGITAFMGQAATTFFALFAAACRRPGFDSYAYDVVGDPAHDADGRDAATEAAPDALPPDAARCPAAREAVDRYLGDSGIAVLGVIRVEWPIGPGTSFFLGVRSKGSSKIETSVVRLRADGSLDPTFGEGGRRTITEFSSQILRAAPTG